VPSSRPAPSLAPAWPHHETKSASIRRCWAWTWSTSASEGELEAARSARGFGSRAKAAARLDLEVSAGWVSPSSRGLWDSDALPPVLLARQGARQVKGWGGGQRTVRWICDSLVANDMVSRFTFCSKPPPIPNATDCKLKPAFTTASRISSIVCEQGTATDVVSAPPIVHASEIGQR
jgi:hypothetical protein